MIDTKDVEIMAPAGSFESLAAAIKGGCNSVYFGVTQLNMRARAAANLTLADLAEVADICQKKNVKTYLAVNTLLYDHDTKIMRKLVDAAKTNHIDAIIAFDFATIQYCNEIGMPVHVSVQFSVSNFESLKFFATMTNRVVLARELTLDQIKAIYDRIREEKLLGREGRLMEIEAFVHGALCVAQSGRCFMSSYTDNASANRGACLQNCRKEYKVTDMETGKELILDNHFVMSAADICTIDFLDELLKSGVQTWKIEGRGRSPEYVYTVTKTYRQALTDIENRTYTKEKIVEYFRALKTVYHRGLSKGNYYLGKELEAYSDVHGSQATKGKIFVGTVKKYFAKVGVAEMIIDAGTLSQGDEIRILGVTTGVYEGKIGELRDAEMKPLQSGKKGDTVTFPVTKRVRINDAVYVWKDK
ncbi:MAG: collagenase-like protease [Candidatus Moranbacteria bacterium CG_4_8_14_3_um_filter_41_13]|nr:MAG: collagenase [Candidatus Moranbacteria bacterium CG2_30_41_165]PIW94050.1 MAG: collagenase-like protease [Candidatus Moranbacteria bacterium CG_4_8_14_3_um_filter_41_13]PJC00519.1 MAG: collagenase-like protease [Candidatus Moranbacteria bacterium CG_4_9_14_0_8_um_filter_41_43]